MNRRKRSLSEGYVTCPFTLDYIREHLREDEETERSRVKVNVPLSSLKDVDISADFDIYNGSEWTRLTGSLCGYNLYLYESHTVEATFDIIDLRECIDVESSLSMGGHNCFIVKYDIANHDVFRMLDEDTVNQWCHLLKGKIESGNRELEALNVEISEDTNDRQVEDSKGKSHVNFKTDNVIEETPMKEQTGNQKPTNYHPNPTEAPSDDLTDDQMLRYVTGLHRRKISTQLKVDALNKKLNFQKDKKPKKRFMFNAFNKFVPQSKPTVAPPVNNEELEFRLNDLTAELTTIEDKLKTKRSYLKSTLSESDTHKYFELSDSTNVSKSAQSTPHRFKGLKLFSRDTDGKPQRKSPQKSVKIEKALISSPVSVVSQPTGFNVTQLPPERVVDNAKNLTDSECFADQVKELHNNGDDDSGSWSSDTSLNSDGGYSRFLVSKTAIGFKSPLLLNDSQSLSDLSRLRTQSDSTYTNTRCHGDAKDGSFHDCKPFCEKARKKSLLRELNVLRSLSFNEKDSLMAQKQYGSTPNLANQTEKEREQLANQTEKKRVRPLSKLAYEGDTNMTEEYRESDKKEQESVIEKRKSEIRNDSDGAKTESGMESSDSITKNFMAEISAFEQFIADSIGDV